MKAAVFEDVERIDIKEIPDPVPGPGDVIVEVKSCGICGSDLEYYTGRSPLGTETGEGPLVLGHEFSGIVSEVGAGVTDLKVGDRVAVNPIQSQAGSDFSRSGNPQFDLATVLGVSVNGAFASHVKSKAEHAYKLPDSLDFDHGAFIEMMAASLHAIEKADIQFGDLVLIYGPGPVGLSMVELAVAKGGVVAMVGTRDYRLEIARDLGATHVFNTRDSSSGYFTPDLVEAIAEINGGELAQRAMVATSVPEANKSALACTGNGATVVFMGLPGPEDVVEVPLLESLTMEKTIRFSWLYPNQWPKTIRAMEAGIVSVPKLVTHHIALDQINEGIGQLGDRGDGIIKMMVNP